MVARAAGILAVLAAAVLAAGCLAPPSNAWGAVATQVAAVDHAPAHGRMVRVALIDSGIALGHPSLRHLDDGAHRDGELVAYTDLLEPDAEAPRDTGGHGTFVAGVLAARPPPGLGTVTDARSALDGLAPEVELLVARACDHSYCSLDAVGRGIRWALENEADVIALSLGYTPAALEQQAHGLDGVRAALAEAEAAGVLVVAAAGNNDGPVLFPARERTVVAVGAMDRDGQPRASSARGYGSAKPDLVAPGQDILGPDADGGRVLHDGTSAAVPFVVAAAVRLMDHVLDPDTAEDLALLRSALLGSAAPLAGQREPHDPHAGFGLLQAGDALDAYKVLVAVQGDTEPVPDRPWTTGGSRPR